MGKESILQRWLWRLVQEQAEYIQKADAVIDAARKYVELGKELYGVDEVMEAQIRFKKLEEALRALDEMWGGQE